MSPTDPSKDHSSSPRQQCFRSRRRQAWTLSALFASAVLIFVATGRDDSLGFTASISGASRSIWSTSKRPSKADAISIFFTIGEQDSSIILAINALLATTVGPYELVTVSNGTMSHNIVDRIVKRHLDYPRRYKYNDGRGLLSYRQVTSSIDSGSCEELLSTSLSTAKYGTVGIVNAHETILDFGWDRLLLKGLRSSQNLMAVSGRVGANIAGSEKGGFSFEDVVGQPNFEVHHDSTEKGIDVRIRHVAVRSPILYDGRKLRKLGGMMVGAEQDGAADIDLCLRGARDHGYACAVRPIATRKIVPSNPSPGTPRYVIKGPIPAHIVARTNLATQSLPSIPQPGLINVTRELDDIPLTIVTAFSANHARTALGLLERRHHSPHTRFIAYILPSPMEFDKSLFADMDDVEFRNFDYTNRPDWMRVELNRGEYAWKDQAVQEVAREFGGLVLWQDAGNWLERSLDQLWREIAIAGVWSIHSGGNLKDWTHPGQLAYLQVPETLWREENCNGAMFALNTFDRRAMATVGDPLFACSEDRDCIAPPGSHRMNHRQDQAALSCLIRLAGYKCWYSAPITIQHDAPGDSSGNCIMNGKEGYCG